LTAIGRLQEADGAKGQVEVVLGLPYLSSGAMTQAARRLQAPVLLSASAFCRNRNLGPVPRRRGDPAPSSGRARNMLEWNGWNLSQLVHAEGLTSIDLDSAGFVAMALKGGFEWTPAQYVLGLCAAHPWRRFSSMDMCVEPEVARDRDEVRERIARTVALNRECAIVSDDAGMRDRLMPVIQGATADDYLRCFDAMSGMVGEEEVIGVGSMCRRTAGGDDGIVSVVERLDRELPKGISLHLFGLKSDGAEAVAMLTPRVASIDSQAYGVRARRLANDARAKDPSFSKSNAFVAGVMETWWTAQVARMARGQAATLQASLPMPAMREPPPATVIDALRMRARAETVTMILDRDLDWDEIVDDCAIEQHAMILAEDLDPSVSLDDAYVSLDQLPECVRDNAPCRVGRDDLHPSLRSGWRMAA
jgi:hypothetical protein